MGKVDMKTTEKAGQLIAAVRQAESCLNRALVDVAVRTADMVNELETTCAVLDELKDSLAAWRDASKNYFDAVDTLKSFTENGDDEGKGK